MPLLVRIVKEGDSFVEALSDVLVLDYLGALPGVILFPLFILPLLGLPRASVVFGILNLAVAVAALPLLDVRGRRRVMV